MFDKAVADGGSSSRLGAKWVERGREGGKERKERRGLAGMGAAVCKLSSKITPQFRRKSPGRL